MIDKRRIDIWDEQEKIYGLIPYPKSLGEWFIMAHKIKKISRGLIEIGLNQEIIKDYPSLITNEINAGAKDICFSKTLGLMNNLLPYSMQVKEHITKDKLITFAFTIFNYMYELDQIIGYLNNFNKIILSKGISQPQTISGKILEITPIPDLEIKVHTFSLNAKQILIEVLNCIKYVCQIDKCNYSTLPSLLPSVSTLSKQILLSKDNILFLWNLRNIFEHPKEDYFCKINNFYFDQGKIINPNWIIVNGKNTIKEDNLVDRLNYFYDFLLNFTESIFHIIVNEAKV